MQTNAERIERLERRQDKLIAKHKSLVKLLHMMSANGKIARSSANTLMCMLQEDDE